MSPHPEPRRILVYPPNPLGDCIMAIPAMRALRARFPDAEISLLLKPSFHPLIDGCEWYDKIIPNAAAEEGWGWQATFRTARALRLQRFDLAVLFANSFRSALICRLASVKRRVGYNWQHRGWLLTDSLTQLRYRSRIVWTPMVEYYLALCAHLGCDTLDRSIMLPVPEHAEAAARTILSRHGVDPDRLILGITPGAKYGPSKLWIDRYYGAVIDHFVTRHDAQVILLTGPGEEEIARSIEAAASHPLLALPGKVIPLDVVKALIRLCTIVLTVDAGPHHIAAAVGAPHVVIQGSTNRFFGETGVPCGVTLWEIVECGPCHLRDCPTDHRCMTRLSPERVIAALEALLREHGQH